MTELSVPQALFWIAVAAVTITSAARLTRLITFDLFPPVRWVREKYATWTDGSDWQLLAYCGYCASFWVTLSVVLWGWLTDWQTAWWIVNGVLGASYIAAVFMSNDGDES
jgi:hypothetical protein